MGTYVDLNRVANQQPNPPYTAIDGTFPNVGPEFRVTLQEIVTRLVELINQRSTELAEFTNAQVEDLNTLISGLAGSADLTDAINTLNNIKAIVDSDGNGILDALGPLESRLITLETTVPALDQVVQAQQTALNASVAELQQATIAIGANTAAINELEDLTTIQAGVAEGKLGHLADWVAHNNQQIRDGLLMVKNGLDALIVATDLPAPAVSISGSGGSSGGGSDDDPSSL